MFPAIKESLVSQSSISSMHLLVGIPKRQNQIAL